MKFLTFTALLAAALFSVVVVLPFLPSAKMQPDVFVVEAEIRSSVDGAFQLYYDDGLGWREELTGRATLTASPNAITYRVALPPGRYRGLRLDPLDRGGSVTISSLQVVAPSGRSLGAIPLDGFTPVNQIQSVTVREGALEIVSEPGGNDPQLETTFAAPLVVRPFWRDYVRVLLPYALPVFTALAFLLWGLDRAPRFQQRTKRAAHRLAAHPARAVAIISAVAVVASAYPIVFLGKSHVSPNLGTTLLYETFPTLPGYQGTETVDVKGSDIGAIMWSHIPLSMVQHRALAQAELPLWNRYNSLGTPLLGQGQSMFGDPLHFFVIACNGAAWAWDVKYLIAKWLFATGLGLTVLEILRRQDSDLPREPAHATSPLCSALIIAFAAPFFGFFLYRLNHPAFFSVCYAPWVLYCWVRGTHAATRRTVALWAAGLIVANVALMNSGTAKEAYMLLLALNFSGACYLLAGEAPWGERFARLAVAAWAGVILVLLTAPVWATFLTTLRQAYTGYNAASAYQVQPSLLLGAFDELFYRPLMAEERTFNPSVNFIILLGLLYFVATWRSHPAPRSAVALAASSLLPLALGFGLISPEWIVTVPFLANIAHLDNTFTCVLLVLWSVLAGVGFAHAAARLGTRQGRGDLLIASLLLFALVFAWFGYRHAAHRPIFGLGQTFSALLPGQTVRASAFVMQHLWVVLAASAVLAVVIRVSLARRRLSAAGGILVVLGGLTLVWRTGLHAGAVGFEDYVARPTLRTDFHARSPAMEFARATQAEEPSRGYGFSDNFFPGWTGVYQLEGIHGPDALVNRYLRELVGDLPGVTRMWDWRLFVEQAEAGTARRFLDALNVRYYFDYESDQKVLTPALTLVKKADLDVYESPTFWPRAFFSSQVDVYQQPADFVRMIGSGDGRPFAAVQQVDVAVQPKLATLPRGLADRTIIRAENYRLTENTTSFDVRAPVPGVVVLSETFWPGDFRAEINGRKVPVLRLNHAFKGVLIEEAGEYHVRFRCVPRNFPRFLLLSGLGVVLLGGSLFLVLRSRAGAKVAWASRP